LDFESNLKQLREKKRIYDVMLDSKRDDVPVSVFDSFKFSEKDEDDVIRITEMLERQRSIYNSYRKKA
jgi:hypothetical protein